MYHIGKTIRQYRLAKNISQKDFAALIGAKNTTLSNWEKGLTRPDVDMLAHICFILDVSADELLGITLPEMALSFEEKQIIRQYRQKTDLQKAVKLLLDVGP